MRFIVGFPLKIVHFHADTAFSAVITLRKKLVQCPLKVG
jgi:hypothetical protein